MFLAVLKLYMGVTLLTTKCFHRLQLPQKFLLSYLFCEIVKLFKSVASFDFIPRTLSKKSSLIYSNIKFLYLFHLWNHQQTIFLIRLYKISFVIPLLRKFFIIFFLLADNFVGYLSLGQSWFLSKPNFSRW